MTKWMDLKGQKFLVQMVKSGTAGLGLSLMAACQGVSEGSNQSEVLNQASTGEQTDVSSSSTPRRNVPVAGGNSSQGSSADRSSNNASTSEPSVAASPSPRPSARPSATPTASPSPTQSASPSQTQSTNQSAGSQASSSSGSSSRNESARNTSGTRKRYLGTFTLREGEYQLSIGEARSVESDQLITSNEASNSSIVRGSTIYSRRALTGYVMGANDWNFDDSISYLRLRSRDVNEYGGASGYQQSGALGVDGDGVDDRYTYECNQGEFIIGLRGRSEDYILDVRPICARPSVEARVYSDGSRQMKLKFVDESEPHRFKTGRSQGDDYDKVSKCQANEVMVGMKVRYKRDGSDEAALTRIRPTCAELKAVNR